MQVVIGMDVAASEFYDLKDKTYDLNFKEEVFIKLYEPSLIGMTIIVLGSPISNYKMFGC